MCNETEYFAEYAVSKHAQATHDSQAADYIAT